MEEPPVIVLGAGGHAKVLIDVLRLTKRVVIGALVPDRQSWGKEIFGIPILGGDDQLEGYSTEEIELVNGIGSVGDLEKRFQIFEEFKIKGFHFSSVIHPSAVIAESVFMSEGVQVMAGCVIQPDCKILENSICNTSVAVDHDCQIGAHCHLSPGVTLSGGVLVGDRTHIGIKAAIIQEIKIGSNCSVAAGSVVVNDVSSNTRVKGVPALAY
jgi:sugar O-acyltransferase (sialic acid O-acetyltransferase NeuD family)